MEFTALIMAGGRGERFWPRSRRNLPKQFLSLTNDGITMIQHTVNRILPLVKMENIYISTNQEYFDLVTEQLPEIPLENILCEPVARNTAPCIALAAIHIEHKYNDSLMIVLPSDHLIKYNDIFSYTLKDACEIASSNDNLVTVGITPTNPETGYGYIKFFRERETIGNSTAYLVEHFVEKPNLDKAKEYLANGHYLWNSGMFVWKTSSILKKFKLYQSELYNGIQRIREHIGLESYGRILTKEFNALKSVSIDYGIMEKSDQIFVIPGSFGWDDVGSWLALERINQTDDFNNVVNGDVITIDTKNTIIQGGNKLISVVGVNNLIVVDTEDALLICNKDDSGSIKKILENLRICNRSEFI